jgi:hypothetical protein
MKRCMADPAWIEPVSMPERQNHNSSVKVKVVCPTSNRDGNVRAPRRRKVARMTGIGKVDGIDAARA